MASIVTAESQTNDEESKDVVLEMRNFVKQPGDPPMSPRLSYLVTLDSRRQQVLLELQTLLKRHAHEQPDQEPKLSKETFCQVFSKRVSLQFQDS